jgi:phage FluMu protein Com
MMTADLDITAPGITWSTCSDCRGRGRVFAGSAVGYVRCPRCQPIQTTPITTTNTTTDHGGNRP